MAAISVGYPSGMATSDHRTDRNTDDDTQRPARRDGDTTPIVTEPTPATPASPGDSNR